ncbi:transcriptional regulator [Xenorhabdus mauleonii]|uniref:Helix-turn-helix n=1 Tax=Xenorhabdus mauleonii TaxID=351675 RepID=A0A1I3WG16_9GAMM|nr:helix-turn-helix transcriptional regulator [Xenorhabdus mauleonii]PHM38953.1 transcriptional regulator [Xenorhabdus mauleonii]SFK06340.1 Helix-turn-helix [Xenorhabdus mauleonii]
MIRHVTFSEIKKQQEELGHRLRQARLNKNIKQQTLSDAIGVNRRIISNAEKGHASLETVLLILNALNLTEQLDLFIPPQPLSPVQLAKMQGHIRQRATGEQQETDTKNSVGANEGADW